MRGGMLLAAAGAPREPQPPAGALVWSRSLVGWRGLHVSQPGAVRRRPEQPQSAALVPCTTELGHRKDAPFGEKLDQDLALAWGRELPQGQFCQDSTVYEAFFDHH